MKEECLEVVKILAVSLRINSLNGGDSFAHMYQNNAIYLNEW